ncbi:hypothetical protein DFH06DRAFT_1326671 [Mycena polygramma]|nr:hypothetical protein DFH06DRAFT_1326671 [Mycena polygramma]
MSLWASPAGLLASPPSTRAPDERAELLPRPSDPKKDWYHYGCRGCEEIRVNKTVVASLCTPDELAEEPYKSMGNTARVCKHTLECDMWYYRAYSKKLEQTLHRVRGERDFVTENLRKTQNTLFELRHHASYVGGKLLLYAGLGSGLPLQRQLQILGKKLMEQVGLGGTGENSVDIGDYDTSMSFSILAT